MLKLSELILSQYSFNFKELDDNSKLKIKDFIYDEKYLTSYEFIKTIEKFFPEELDIENLIYENIYNDKLSNLKYLLENYDYKNNYKKLIFKAVSIEMLEYIFSVVKDSLKYEDLRDLLNHAKNLDMFKFILSHPFLEKERKCFEENKYNISVCKGLLITGNILHLLENFDGAYKKSLLLSEALINDDVESYKFLNSNRLFSAHNNTINGDPIKILTYLNEEKKTYVYRSEDTSECLRAGANECFKYLWKNFGPVDVENLECVDNLEVAELLCDVYDRKIVFDYLVRNIICSDNLEEAKKLNIGSCYKDLIIKYDSYKIFDYFKFTIDDEKPRVMISIRNDRKRLIEIINGEEDVDFYFCLIRIKYLYRYCGKKFIQKYYKKIMDCCTVGAINFLKLKNIE